MKQRSAVFGMDPADLNGMDFEGLDAEEITDDALSAPFFAHYEDKEALPR